jgi:hypothetical protein
MRFIRRETLWAACGSWYLQLAGGLLTIGCEPTASAPPPKVTHVVISPVADSEVVRSIGVPTDPDDTMATSFQKHETARRVAAPDCLPTGVALCVSDTAQTRVAGETMSNMRETTWLVFAAANDSMQLFVAHPSAYIRMTPLSAAGFGAETSGNVDASWIRPRFLRSGTYVFTAAIEADSSVAYELRVVPVVARGASRPIGVSATLQLAGDSSARVVVAPASMVASIPAPRLERFAVRPGTYHVLLVRDTTYVTCRLPCADRGTFVMHAGTHVALRGDQAVR